METPNNDSSRTPDEAVGPQEPENVRYAANELSVADRQVNILRDKLRHIDRQLAAAIERLGKSDYARYLREIANETI